MGSVSSGLVFSRTFSYTKLHRQVVEFSQHCISLGESFRRRNKRVKGVYKVNDRPQDVAGEAEKWRVEELMGD